MNTYEEQMQILDLTVKSTSAPSFGDPVFSAGQPRNGEVTGSFTGTTIFPTMTTRPGRGLLAPGPRVLDTVILNEVTNTTKRK